ncbi:putative invertase inhibitor [Rhodamnia argentea]|uniref:Invertase inhibitor n=1 Tax=Rhodamnia argentea TaxID=178133 RepID=A0A8B8MVJ3_9MYRT|nr:putative invertase inhibitor [Rhodamnia argentea]
MNGAFSISSLFLIHFLIIFCGVQSASDLIQDTCKKIAAIEVEVNFDFCVKSLGSDPHSHEVDLEGLGLIAVKLSQANITSTIEYTKQLLKQKLDPRLLKYISFCWTVYAPFEGKDVIPFYKAKDYKTVGSWATVLGGNEDMCDSQLTQKKGMVPPLTKRNAEISQLSAIVVDIMHFLGWKA